MGGILYFSKEHLNFINIEILKTIIFILLGISVYSIIILLIMNEEREKLRLTLIRILRRFNQS
jgi:hypothetical protein